MELIRLDAMEADDSERSSISIRQWDSRTHPKQGDNAKWADMRYLQPFLRQIR